MDIISKTGKKIPLDKAAAVERLLSLKRKHGSDPWPVIEECIKVWKTYNPERWNAYIVYIDDTRNTRKDHKFASTHDKTTGGYLRYTLDIPQEVMLMIRLLYSNDELPMNKKFFLEFARKFPTFKVADRL